MPELIKNYFLEKLKIQKITKVEENGNGIIVRKLVQLILFQNQIY